MENYYDKRLVFVLFVVFCIAFSNTELAAQDLLDLSIEQLMEVEISASLVSRKAKELSKTPASVFVLSSEDIRRSGMTTIPEILRLVPGLDISRLSSNDWSINARGSSKKFASEFIVMIDGRIVSTPLFDSIDWGPIDTFIPDIDHIEVVEGPGGTSWDSNAVNGIINIVTKNANKTLGNKISIVYGTADNRNIAIRHGGNMGKNGAYRFYFKGETREPFRYFDTSRAEDQSKSLSTGFRLDWKHSDDITLKLIGNAFRQNLQEKSFIQKLLVSGKIGKKVGVFAGKTNGANLLVSMDRKIDNDQNYRLQLYYDKTTKDQYDAWGSVEVIDFDFQHSFSPIHNHGIVWGVGYRRRLDSFSIKAVEEAVQPLSDKQETISAFIQDDVTLIPNQLVLTLGSKFYRNSYVHSQNAPTARLMWNPNAKHAFWSSISEAHRTPIRAETSRSLPLGYAVDPTSGATVETYLQSRSLLNMGNLEPEYLKAKELGYRFSPNKRVSLSLNYYKHEYFNLLMLKRVAISGPILLPSPHIRLTVSPDNMSSSVTDGVLASSRWKVRNDWQLFFGYSTSWTKSSNGLTRGTNPDETWFIRSNFDLKNRFEIDSFLSHTSSYTFVHELSRPTNIDAHLRFDLRLGWKYNDSINISLGGQNLLTGWHKEIGSSFTDIPSEIPRNYYFKVEMNF